MALALVLLILKGSSSDAQQGFLGAFLNHYVEETTAAVITYPSPYQLAEANSVGGVTATMGRTMPASLNALQGNSLVSHGTILADTIDVPAGDANQVVDYEVQDGDVLSLIASDYGVSTNSIIWSNNLKNADAIKPGMVLKIPAITGVVYTIKTGDTVASIAKKYSADSDKILSFNKLSPTDSLDIGQEITIPDGKPSAAKPKGSSGYADSTSATQRFSHLPELAGYFGAPAAGYDWGIIHGHNGVDVANSCGTPIYAAATGTVKLVKNDGWNGGYGHYIVLTHPNGTETLYGHTMRNLVAAIGQAVTKGQEIALMGTTGHSTGCHVHFEVHGAKNPMAK